MGWAFGDFELDDDTYELRHLGHVRHVEPQAFDVLVHLVANRHRVVSKAELLHVVWAGRPVGEAALTTRIKEVRRALGDTGRAQATIRTVHGRGYRFVGEVRLDAPARLAGPGLASDQARAPTRADQTLATCTAPDGVRIAYGVIGDGPAVVQHATPLTHLMTDWDSQLSLDWITLLGRGRRLVRYDQRGSGMSQAHIPTVTIDALLGDVGAVADAAGLDRFVLVAHSIHALAAVRFAAQRPERLERLVVVGCPLVGPLAPSAQADQHAEFALSIELFSQGWGRDRHRLRRMIAEAMMPDAPPHITEQYANLRHRPLAENISEALRVSASIDLTDVAPQLDVPTLVVHARGDTMVSVRSGEALAHRIPDARFVELPSRAHLLHAADPGWPVFRDAFETFLRG